MWFLSALIVAFAMPAPAQAIHGGSSWVTDAVIGHPDTIYLDLLKQIAPDLAPTGNDTFHGTLARPLRHIMGGEPSAMTGDPVVIDSATALPLRAGGEERLLVMAELGELYGGAPGFTMLALFDDAPTPHLLDAADVSIDRFTIFSSPPLLDLSPGDQAILVGNGHYNSNQTYGSTLMLFVSDGRLTMIGEVSDFSDRSCAFEHLQKPSFEVVPEPRQPYASIRASVLDQIIPHDRDCGDEEQPAPFERTISAIFRWDAGEKRFVADSDALEKLATENEARY
jgi:hypothetical protein